MRVVDLAAALTVAAGWVTVPGARASTPQPTIEHFLNIELNVPTHVLVARDSVRVPTSMTQDGVLRFLLHRGLELSGIREKGQNLLFEISDGWNPKDFWERPPYGELAGFEVARECKVFLPSLSSSDEANGGSRVLVFKYGGVIADSLHAPDVAYDRSFETTSGRIVEQGAFLSGSSFWIPWFGDHLVTFGLTVNLPPDWTAVSQGRLVTSESDRPGSVRWECGDPMEEIVLVAGPYRMKQAAHGDVGVMTFCYENTGDEITDRYIEGTKRYLDEYGARFGPYPFPKFALVENYWQSGLGMPSFTLLGDQVIRLPFILDTSYGHEILHNWWGNGVFVREEGGNWCEGLTTYCSDYASKEKEGPAAAEDYRRSTLVGYRDFAAAGGKDFPLVQFRERNSASTQAVGYGKTMMVFHMLRSRIGAAAFDGSLRRFYSENRFREADWGDLRRAFEAQTGSDLSKWFAQWIEREGAPRLMLADAHAERAGRRGDWFATGVIEQADPPFDLQVPVRVVSAKDTTWSAVSCTGPRTEFRIAAGNEPREISVDPACDVFRILHEGEIAPTLSGVLGATHTRYVIGADVDEGMRTALREVLNAWGIDSTATVVEERDARDAKWDGATWILGDGEWARSLRRGAVERAAASWPQGTIVFTSQVEATADRPIAVFVPANAADAVAVARKVPHYAKYTYLVFDGTKNVAKGMGEPGESPLRSLVQREN